MGFEVYATPTTAHHLKGKVHLLKKISDGEPNILSEIKKGKMQLVFNTPKKGKVANTDGFRIRQRVP